MLPSLLPAVLSTPDVLCRHCVTEVKKMAWLTMTVGGGGLDHSLSRYTQGDLKSCISSLV